MNTVIKRCPSCPTIRARAEEIVSSLEKDLDIDVATQDGAKGEFTVLVDGVPLLQRDGETLPSVEEVEAAVQGAAPVGV
ncbi:hypothetical protein [Zavarzinella formosa]|uniref:hypothetical protein n=1 Tax=Zavarzinella formosa TaxID=360055 RepID=UPI0002FB8DEB|nr:hypothetical protein [Zavarzinella formosa]